MIVGLVGCSKVKAAESRPAAELYASPLFLYSYRAAVRSCDAVAILSAKYGLVDPAEVIAPYDLVLHQLDSAERAEWRRVIASELWARFFRERTDRSKLVFFAGAAYAAAVGELPGVDRVEPLRGLGIGRRFQRLATIEPETFRRELH